MLIFVFHNTSRFLENAEMTRELHDDLINLSFDNLHDFFFKARYPNDLRLFIARLLNCLKKLVSMPSFYAFPYIFKQSETAIIRRTSYLPDFSSWLRQDAL